MNDSELSTLLAKFLLYMMDNGVTVKYEGNLSELRDEFIAQLNKPDPVLIGMYNSMEYGGHEVQMMHPGARLEIEDGKFYVYERQ